MIKGPTICWSGGKLDKNGRQINEDFVIKGSNYAILLDGSTGLSDFQFSQEMTNAEWYVKQCGEFLKNRLEKQQFEKLSDIVVDCIEYVKKKIQSMEEKLGYKLSKFEIPSACIVILRESNDMTDIFALGDSSVMIKKKNGDSILLREDSICSLDRKVLDRLSEISKKENINVSDAKNNEEIKEMLIRNREKKNSNEKDGYWILSIEIEAVKHAKDLSMQSKDIEKIICVSDGFNYKIQGLTYEQFLDKCNSENILEYAKQSIIEEENDVNCNKCPRLKLHDDMSGFVWVPEKN